MNGAHVGDTFMSLIHTSGLAGENPFDYLTALQKHAAALAQKYRCPLVTGDPELRSVTDLELDWIGRATA